MEKEIITFSRSGPSLVARISCEIDHHTAARLRTRIDRELFCQRPEVLRLDFCEVRFMDSSGIAFVLGRATIARAIEASLVLRGLDREMHRLFSLSGIEKQTNITIQ